MGSHIFRIVWGALFIGSCIMVVAVFLPTEAEQQAFYASLKRQPTGFADQQLAGFSLFLSKNAHPSFSLRGRAFLFQKKKIGFLRFGMLKEVMVANAEVDFFEEHPEQSEQSLAGIEEAQKTHSFSFDQDIFPPMSFKNVVGVVLQPVTVRLHRQGKIERIRADQAELVGRDREIVFHGRIFYDDGQLVRNLDHLVGSISNGRVHFSLPAGI